MILHIATDEKFIDAAYKVYEKAFPNRNKFLIIRDKNIAIKHLSKELQYNFIDPSINYIKAINNEVYNCNLIVLHSLNIYNAKIALAYKEKTIVWTLFGKEFYENVYIKKKNIYGKSTFAKYLGLKYRVHNIFRTQYYKFLSRKENPQLLVKKSMRVVDFLAILYKEEFDLIQQNEVVNEDVKFLSFTYYPRDFIIKKNNSNLTKKNKVLIGNSATPTNNHIEVFKIIEESQLFKDSKIVCPLNYGDEAYKNDIIIEGKKRLGQKFFPLLEFLPLNEYQEILEECGVVIMNHYRQQAVGNVLNTLYSGAKVFLSNQNTLYHYLKRIGCNVYCIENDLNRNNTIELLNDDQIKTNQKILDQELSIVTIADNLRKIIIPIIE